MRTSPGIGIKNRKGTLRAPFEPLAAGCAWPSLPEVGRLVAVLLHRAIVVAQGDGVTVTARRRRRCGPASGRNPACGP